MIHKLQYIDLHSNFQRRKRANRFLFGKGLILPLKNLHFTRNRNDKSLRRKILYFIFDFYLRIICEKRSNFPQQADKCSVEGTSHSRIPKKKQHFPAFPLFLLFEKRLSHKTSLLFFNAIKRSLNLKKISSV